MLVIKRLMTRYMPGMLTCQQVDRFLYDYHEGQLSFAENIKFKFHLSMCTDCQAYVSGYKQTIASIKASEQIEQRPEKIPEDLVQAILKSIKR
ncbi:MAG: zf-HC2 domain-containing protein [Algicola sp.]|nr:zf-HC2 domain-containing protein [Algicola sp.]